MKAKFRKGERVLHISIVMEYIVTILKVRRITGETAGIITRSKYEYYITYKGFLGGSVKHWTNEHDLKKIQRYK